MHILRVAWAFTNATPKITRTVPKIAKSVVVQHKIGVRMMNVKNRTKYDLQNKLI